MQAPFIDAHTHQLLLLRQCSSLRVPAGPTEWLGPGACGWKSSAGEREGSWSSRCPQTASADPAPAGMFALLSSERAFPAPETLMAAQPPAQSLHKKPPPGADHYLEHNFKWKKVADSSSLPTPGCSAAAGTPSWDLGVPPEADSELNTF